jgi:hypothetical protein
VDSGRNNRSITDINSRTETLNSKDANNSRDTNHCISCITGRPTATEMPQKVWMPTTNEFLWKFAKNLSELLQFMKKDAKEQKLLIFISIDFGQSDRYQTIGSPQLLV